MEIMIIRFNVSYINNLNLISRNPCVNLCCTMTRGLFIACFALLTAVAVAQECLPDNERVDCHPEWDASEQKCLSRGCTWCEAQIPDLNTPWCFLPTNYGYRMVGEPVNTGNGFRVQLQRATTSSMYGSDSEHLTLDAVYDSNQRLHIKVTDGTPRWEVPLVVYPASGGNTNPLYDVIFVNSPVFSFKVIRKATGTVLFDTSLGGFTFSDQFLQLGIKLPSRNVYGLGEIEQGSFKHSFEKHPRFAMWALDEPPNGDANMYGVQPYYTVLENDGNAHSVAIVNSNAQEFEMHPNPGIIYRTIGGVIDMYFFLGPTPEHTVQQYTEMVGRAPLPPYWALGFQLCKYGYDTLENMRAAVDRTAQFEIPQDVQYGDIDIMDRELDFTVDPIGFPDLPAYVRELKTKGVKFMTILDPCISIGEPAGSYRPLELGNQMDVWVKHSDGRPVIGKVWPADPVHFPDYHRESTREWWKILIKEFHDLLEFDGLWIDMNEPASFVAGDFNEGCANNKWNNPPYRPRLRGDSLAHKTICPDHVDDLGLHYNTHSLYGWSESEPTLNATNEATQSRAFVLSRSTFLGSGKWVAHWLGDNWSQWSNLHFSIIGMLQFNHFGIPFVGSDICGFIGNTTSEMCTRWMQLGAFYPFARNHNALGSIDQDPGVWGAESAASSRNALNIRYTLLPYLYTLLADHYMYGGTVARALWHEFPTDSTAAAVDTQFLWGKGFMISPVLSTGQNVVRVYFPADRFFDYYTGAEIGIRQASQILDAPSYFINLHIRGGNILPTQEPALNTVLSRQKPLGLIVALDDWGVANGTLYYDAGDSIQPIESGAYFKSSYAAASGELVATVIHDGYPPMSGLVIDNIRLLGAFRTNEIVIIGNNGTQNAQFTIRESGEIVMSNLGIRANSEFRVRYNL